jgi:hypothetical protein
MKRGDLRKLIQEHRWVLPAKMSFYDWPDGWDDLVVKLVEDLAKEAWDRFL